MRKIASVLKGIWQRIGYAIWSRSINSPPVCLSEIDKKTYYRAIWIRGKIEIVKYQFNGRFFYPDRIERWFVKGSSYEPFRVYYHDPNKAKQVLIQWHQQQIKAYTEIYGAAKLKG